MEKCHLDYLIGYIENQRERKKRKPKRIFRQIILTIKGVHEYCCIEDIFLKVNNNLIQ